MGGPNYKPRLAATKLARPSGMNGFSPASHFITASNHGNTAKRCSRNGSVIKP
jgi:hypothetical protein